MRSLHIAHQEITKNVLFLENEETNSPPKYITLTLCNLGVAKSPPTTNNQTTTTQDGAALLHPSSFVCRRSTL
jgi:hypothetical protein